MNERNICPDNGEICDLADVCNFFYCARNTALKPISDRGLYKEAAERWAADFQKPPRKKRNNGRGYKKTSLQRSQQRERAQIRAELNAKSKDKLEP